VGNNIRELWGHTSSLWPVTKSLMKRDLPKAPTAIHCSLGYKFHPLEKCNMTVDCLENQFTPHYLYKENHELQVESRVETLLKYIQTVSHVAYKI
jgi:hypothetical protein